jgi:GAF domain-containing protein
MEAQAQNNDIKNEQPELLESAVKPNNDNEKHLNLLLRASSIIANAKGLKQGLQELAEMIVSLFSSSFCRILLLDETEDFLVPEAGYLATPQGSVESWEPVFDEPTPISDWPGLRDRLIAGVPRILEYDNDEFRPNLIKLTRRLNLQRPIHSLLVVPLKIEGKIIGLLHIGNLDEKQEDVFSKEKIALAYAIAAQTTTLIERIRLFENTRQHNDLLAGLTEALRYVSAEKELHSLLKTVVNLAVDLFHMEAGGLYINRPYLRELELRELYRLGEEYRGDQLRGGGSIVELSAIERKLKSFYLEPGKDCKDPFINKFGFKTVVCIPIKQPSGEVEAVLFIANREQERRFSKTDIMVMERYATQAGMALQTSRLIENKKQRFTQLSVLQKLSEYVQVEENLNKILHAVLTTITAGYGLGFNRALILLLNERRDALIGRMGIGQLESVEAQEIWHDPVAYQISNFQDYLDHLTKSREVSADTSVGRMAVKLGIPVIGTGADVFSEAIIKREPRLVEAIELPEDFAKPLNVESPAVVIPLIVKGHSIGLLVVDNKFTGLPISNDDIEFLLKFASVAAIAIENNRILQETKRSQEKLFAFYKASTNFNIAQDRKRVWADVGASIRAASEASWVTIILIDEMTLNGDHELTDGLIRVPSPIMKSSEIDSIAYIRPQGISMQVASTGNFVRIPDIEKEKDRVSQFVIKENSKAALCLPLSLPGKRLGVVWLHYDSPRPFPEYEISALQLYVNNAATAYDGVMRMTKLESMRKAAEALAAAADMPQVLDQLVHRALMVLDADSAIVWCYDPEREVFIVENSAADGIDKDSWSEWRIPGPRSGGTASRVLKEKWFPISNVKDAIAKQQLGSATQNTLLKLEAESFQGIALTVGGEELGILYVNYKRRRIFTLEDRKSALTFANHAALALKQAKLLNQVERARIAAEAVANVTTLGDRDATLNTIVLKAKEALDCDSAVLFEFDQEKKTLRHPPKMAGIYHEEEATATAQAYFESMLNDVLRRDTPLIKENADACEQFKQSSFVKLEGFKSLVGICLRVAIPTRDEKQEVGVMFINYRTRHHFTSDQLRTIDQFACQAAIAIYNAQLFERSEHQNNDNLRKKRYLRALYESCKIITESVSSNWKAVLDQIAKQAVESITGVEGPKAIMATIQLYDEQADELVIESLYPPDALSGRNILGQRKSLGPQKDKGGRIGVTGRAVRDRKAQLVVDVSTDKDYRNLNDKTRSELAVLFIGKDGDQDESGSRKEPREYVLGVLNVESDQLKGFDEQDWKTLESLADLAAIVIQNARHYEELKQTKGLVAARTALAWMGMARNYYQHTIVQRAGTIILQLTNIMGRSSEMPSAQQLPDWAGGYLANIKEQANYIIKLPITPTLQSKDGLTTFPIKSLIMERLDQLWKKEPHRSIRLAAKPEPDDKIVVRASRDWLIHALDLLIDNAIKALEGVEPQRRSISVETQVQGDGIEILITDTALGFPDEVLKKVFTSKIDQEGDSVGMGIGLLMAQAIVETYSGKLWIKKTNSDGTSIAIRLPLAREQEDKTEGE